MEEIQNKRWKIYKDKRKIELNNCTFNIKILKNYLYII